MQVVSFGNTYNIFEDTLELHGQVLPVGTYDVAFHPMSGYSLVQKEDYKPTEKKVYGNHQVKIDKVMHKFESSNRSLGIILSGKKGIGKSLFTQLLGLSALKNNIPVLFVEDNTPGIDKFIASIDQEVLIIFDEFEKRFPENSNDEISQNDLLGLLDGMVQRKHIYAITVNNTNKLSEFFLNRPGRFHYHFKFANPKQAEVKEYLNDNLHKEYQDTELVNRILDFSLRADLNFDCLRAITEEINLGSSLEDALEDLNISNTEDTRYEILYEIVVEKTSGETATLYGKNHRTLSLFGNIPVTVDGFVGENGIDLRGTIEHKDLTVSLDGVSYNYTQTVEGFGNKMSLDIYDDALNDKTLVDAKLVKVSVNYTKQLKNYSYATLV